MAVVQISKIQHRRGKEGQNGIPQLASAELGWAIDTQKLYIGNGAVSEGAPAVGNTEILTSKSNIFDLLQQYSYKGTTEAVKQTGEFVNSPVTRTLQERLDDIVSIRSFGAKGDGITDDTSAIQRAIDELFINSSDKSDARSRIALKIDAGKYRVTNTIYIPPFANIIGDGKNKTIIELNLDPAEGVHTAKSMIETIDGTSTPGNYVTFQNIQNGTRPRNINIHGITLTVAENVTPHAPLVRIDNTTDTIINDCLFQGRWTKDEQLDASQVGIDLRGLGATTTENLHITNCTFRDLSIAIHSIHDTRTVTIADSILDFLHIGIDLGRTSSGSGAQSLGPQNFIIRNNKFDRINDYGIAVHKPVSTMNPVGHISTGNVFLDVGNNMNGQDNPQTGVILFDETLCESIGDTFERDSIINLTANEEIPYKPTVEGYHYTKGRVNTYELSESDAFKTFTKLPFTDKKIAYMDYKLIKTTGSATTRAGRLTITVQDNSNINVTDSYSHTGSSDGGVEFGAILDDLDSTTGSETVKVQFKNLIGNGAGTLTYAFSYFA